MKCFRIGSKRIKYFDYTQIELMRAGNFLNRMGIKQIKVDPNLMKTIIVYNRVNKIIKRRIKCQK